MQGAAACLGHGCQGAVVHVDEEAHVRGELAEQREEDVGGEDVGVRPLWRQLVQRLGVRDYKEEHCAQHAHHRRLEVPKFHTLRTPIHLNMCKSLLSQTGWFSLSYFCLQLSKCVGNQLSDTICCRPPQQSRKLQRKHDTDVLGQRRRDGGWRQHMGPHLQVHNGEGVGGGEADEAQDLEHLDGGHKRGAPLPDDVRARHH